MSASAADRPGWRLERPQNLARLGGAIGVRLERGEAVCLSGPLGVGKSTLARGLIRSLARPDEEAPSPTFTLVQTYETPRLVISHFDLYRLRSLHELEELGLEEALELGAAVIEWPERLGDDLPPARLDVELRFPADGSVQGRLVDLTGHGPWGVRADQRVEELAEHLVSDLGHDCAGDRLD